MRELLVDGAHIRYTATGAGPRLVMVHGAGPGAHGCFGHVAGRFAGRRVVLPDIAGSDDVSDGGGSLTVEALARQVVAVVEDSGDGPVDLLGFSLGTPVATTVAAKRPDLVRRLILVAGFAHRDEHVRNLMTTWLRVGDDAEAFGRLGVFTAFSARFLDELGTEAVEGMAGTMRPTVNTLRQLDLVLRADVRDVVGLVRAETLVIGCAGDNTIPVGNAQRLHAGITGSRYSEVDAGHVVMFERPDEFVRLVTEFLDAPSAAEPGSTSDDVSPSCSCRRSDCSAPGTRP